MKRNESKALARIKRIYKSGNWWVSTVEKCGHAYRITRKRCESITEFLKSSRYAKLLKNTTTPFRTKEMQIEQHRKNKQARNEAKRQVLEGILEWDEQYDEDPTCSNCEFYTVESGPYCIKHKQFIDCNDSVCKYFRD